MDRKQGRLMIALLLVAALLLLAACGGRRASEAAPTPTAVATFPPAATATPAPVEAPTEEPTAAPAQEPAAEPTQAPAEEPEAEEPEAEEPEAEGAEAAGATIPEAAEVTGAEAVTDTAGIAATDELTGGQEMADTEAVTGTEAVTDTGDVAATEEMTDTAAVTETEEMAGAGGVTGAAETAAAIALPDGLECLWAGEGATLAFDGKRVNYTCAPAGGDDAADDGEAGGTVPPAAEDDAEGAAEGAEDDAAAAEGDELAPTDFLTTTDVLEGVDADRPSAEPAARTIGILGAPVVGDDGVVTARVAMTEPGEGAQALAHAGSQEQQGLITVITLADGTECLHAGLGATVASAEGQRVSYTCGETESGAGMALFDAPVLSEALTVTIMAGEVTPGADGLTAAPGEEVSGQITRIALDDGSVCSWAGEHPTLAIDGEDVTFTCTMMAAVSDALIEATDMFTATKPVDAGVGMTETEGMTSTSGMTETEGMVESEEMTETEGITDTSGMTEGEGAGMAETEGITGTAGMTETVEMTETEGMTEGEGAGMKVLLGDVEVNDDNTITVELATVARGDDGFELVESELITFPVTRIDLADGMQCLWAGGGATMAFDGKRLNYTCEMPPGDESHILLGELVAGETAVEAEVALITRTDEGHELVGSEVQPVTLTGITLEDGDECILAGEDEERETEDGERVRFVCPSTGILLVGEPVLGDLGTVTIASGEVISGADGESLTAGEELAGRVTHIQTADGMLCPWAGEGATLAFDGKRANYTCEPAASMESIVLLGDLEPGNEGVFIVERASVIQGDDGFELQASEMVPAAAIHGSGESE